VVTPMGLKIGSLRRRVRLASNHVEHGTVAEIAAASAQGALQLIVQLFLCALERHRSGVRISSERRRGQPHGWGEVCISNM
jgi:hypothetical protein